VYPRIDKYLEWDEYENISVAGYLGEFLKTD
jgi:hypothetical protein